MTDLDEILKREEHEAPYLICNIRAKEGKENLLVFDIGDMGNASCAEYICKVSIFIHIDFVNSNAVDVFFGDFLENWRKFFAGATPVSVEIKHQEMFS